MTSLDGYSLNEKMDTKFKEVQEQIEVLRFQLESELQSVRKDIKEIVSVKSCQCISKKKKIKESKIEAK